MPLLPTYGKEEDRQLVNTVQQLFKLHFYEYVKLMALLSLWGKKKKNPGEACVIHSPSHKMGK